jgi:hypothetical protein
MIAVVRVAVDEVEGMGAGVRPRSADTEKTGQKHSAKQEDGTRRFHDVPSTA